MAIWIKLSVLFMVISLFFHYSSSINKDVKSTTSEFTFSDDDPVGDTNVAETQQVSLITTIEYMPVEAKEAQEKGEDLAPLKTEEREAAPTGDEELGTSGVHPDESSSYGEKEDGSRGNKNYKKTPKDSDSGSKRDRLKVPRGKRLGTLAAQDHRRNKAKNSRDIREKYLRERKEKTQNESPDLKDALKLESRDAVIVSHGKDQTQLNGTKIDQNDKKQESNDPKKAANIKSSIIKEKPQTHQQEFREGRKGRKKRGSEDGPETSEGDEHTGDNDAKNSTPNLEKKKNSSSDVSSVRIVVRKKKLRPSRNDAQDKETKQEKKESLKKETEESEKKYGERKRRQKIRAQVGADERTSQAGKTRLQTAKTSKQRRRRRPTNQNKQESNGKEASTRDSSKKEISDEPKYGERLKTKKPKPNKRISRQEKVIPLEKAEITQRRRQRKIRHKNDSNKERKQRKIDTALHGKPLSIFVRKEDLHKLKNYKKGAKYGGQVKHYKKPHKHLLYEEDNEIWDDIPDKDDQAAVKKPSVVAKVTADVYSSKEPTSSENDEDSKSYLNPIPLLKKQKTQQISLISDVAMEHSSTEKKRKPKSSGYKHEKAHKAVQYEASGEKVAKGEHSSSGYKNKHRGDHGKSHDSKFHDNGAQDEKGHHFQKEYHGKYDAGKKKSKGHAKGSKGEYEKGFNNKGFKNLHHKLEYSSRQKYFDEDEAKKYLKAADDFDSFFNKHVNSYNDNHKHLDDSHHSKHGYEEFDFDKEFENYMKKHKNEYKHHDYHGDHRRHGNKKKYENHHYHHHHHWRK